MNLSDHLEKLKYFYEIARLGSMKKASESIYVTQPSLTKSIKILESSIGHDLFIRLPRGLKLTREGQLLYEYCHTLFASISDIEQKLSHPDDPYAGSLRVGTYDSIGVFFWPKFLKYFFPKYPKMNFEITTGRSSQMQEKIEAGELDLILVIEPKSNSKVTVEKIHKDSFKFYESTKMKKVYSDIQDAPLIMMPSALAGKQSLEDVLYSFQLSHKKIYKNSSLESVKELTLNGIGIGLLPQKVAKESIQKKLLREVKIANSPSKGVGEHLLGIAYQKERKNSPLIKALIQELKASSW